MIKASQIRSRLRAGSASVGSWLQIPSTAVAQILGAAGYDWVAIDLEHGSIGIEILPDLCLAIRSNGSLPLVRVARNSSKDIATALDAGAHGVIVPMVCNAAEAEAAVQAASYPPLGKRGVGYSRASLFGQRFDEYLQDANEERLLIIQIEQIEAIHNCREILSVPGIDAVMIGPYDLSGSMGLTGQFDHPKFLEALATFTEMARECRVPTGMHVVTPDPTKLQNSIDQGYQFIAYCVDGVFLWYGARCPAVTAMEPGRLNTPRY